VLCEVSVLNMNVEDISNVSGDSTHDDPGEGTSAQTQAEAPVSTVAGGAQGEAAGKNTPRLYQCGVCQNKHPKPTGTKCPFGPPAPPPKQVSAAGSARQSSGSADDEDLKSVLKNISVRLLTIEERLEADSRDAATAAAAVHIPEVRRCASLTPSLQELRGADRASGEAGG
jgi:hypothetical protein